MLDLKPIFYVSTPKCLRIANYLQRGTPGLQIKTIDDISPISQRNLVFVRGLWDSHIEKIHYLQRQGIDFITIDNGYVGRSPYHGDGYYRMTWNSYQETQIYNRPSDRWEALNIPVTPWKFNPDGPIIICGISPQTGKLYNMNPEYWLELQLRKIPNIIKNEIVVREKPKGDPRLFFKYLKPVIENAYCLLTYNSVAAVEAVICGIPVVTWPVSVAAPIGLTFIDQINTLVRPNRDKWFNSLAYCQFTLDEMASGFAMDEMYKKYKEIHNNAQQNICGMG